MYAYEEDYNNVNEDGQRRERRKKKHRKPRDEIPNDQDAYNEPVANYDDDIGRDYRRSEEENFDPNERRKHRSRHKRREEPPVDENDHGLGYLEEVPPPQEDEILEEDPGAKKKKKKKRKPREQLEEEEPYQNTNLESPMNDHNYPFEDDPEPPWHPDDEEYVHDEEQPEYIEEPQPPVEKPKKKSGGFSKIFESFKKRKNKNKEKSSNEKPWQSNPEIFDPAYDESHAPSSRKVKAGKNPPGSRVHIILLDGEEIEQELDPKAPGRLLFDKVCDYLNLVERDFFGLTYVSSKQRTWFWLDMDKKVNKQLTNDDDWTFNFQVKFYPPEPVLLQEDLTRYLLCLQIRQDIYTGKLPCSWITQALLGSFLVQSELGDYDDTEYGESIDYLREFEFVMQQTDELLEKIMELHRKHNGMGPDKADIKYLETAKRLEQYGVDLHPARDNDNIEIYIGVCYQGVLIYRDRLRIGRFAWPKVLRISYKKNYFYLKIRSDKFDDSVAIVGFKLFNHYLAKRLWKNAVEQHTFFRMKEPQYSKPTLRIVTAGTSNFTYGGKTLHQYRTMNINRGDGVKFDRTLAKRRTIGSMPAGLNRAGMQYNSMHSLNRAHPREMTLGKTKSVEHLGVKRPGSAQGYTPDNQGSYSNLKFNASPAPRYPPFGSVSSNKDDDRHQSFHSGDSLNADSYTVRQDDQVSLPSLPRQDKPIKKQRSNQPIDVLSDDGIISPTPRVNLVNKPSKKATPPSVQPVSPPLSSVSPPIKVMLPQFKVASPQPRVTSPPVNPVSPVAASTDSEDLDSLPKASKRKSSNKPTSMSAQVRQPSMPKFQPPPPPPPEPDPPSKSSSQHSSPLPHHMPPPPPPVDVFPKEPKITYKESLNARVNVATERPKPPTKPKPQVLPKPKVGVNVRANLELPKASIHVDDDLSSNDDML